jgi:hypothetical protein
MPGWLFASFHDYDRKWFRGDLVDGLTVWATLLLYAAFGSSRHLIVGPMSATAALSAATVSSVATAGSGRFVELTAALAISAGLAALWRARGPGHRWRARRPAASWFRAGSSARLWKRPGGRGGLPARP